MIPDRILARLTQIPGARSLWGRFAFGSVDTRVRYGVFDRPHYAYGVYAAADLAKRLGLDRISVIEMGVAGGKGLLALERIAKSVGNRFAIRIDVTGFDSGQGMPAPNDYRDLPYVWDKGFYKMDVSELKARLSPATELIIGDVEQTVPSWVPKASIGFVAFDLDYYSSTKTALGLFGNHDANTRLPRCYCYFDDLMWPEYACHNEYVGELCAIKEFNEQHESKKLCPIHMFRHSRVHQAAWNEQMYVLHDFKHPLYCKNVTPSGDRYTQIPL
ncbi:MAG TPA: hypothetical protein VNY05_02360 [Candidatus Acidoferrales bacterium]|jgi:hypothetical protein|nr:hypothetical protein [Candidatus Acidoferrales bacterium]